MNDPAASDQKSLDIATAENDGTYVVRLLGELDMSSCEAVDQALQAAEQTSAARILLDIEGLKFIDSSGLQVILRAKRRSDAGGKRLRVTRGKGHVADMFRLTALDMTLPFAESANG